MAFILNNLLSSLDSSIGSLDSSSDLLEILQAINVTNPAKGYGKSRRKTYDSFAALPPASADFRGTLAVVQSAGSVFARSNIENTENGLYLCDGTEWSIVEELDSAHLPIFQGTNYGYTSGGAYNSFAWNIIDKFPFASNGNATDVGDLTLNRFQDAGQSSETHGYTSGVSGNTNVIDKFPFASDGNATDVGDLSVARYSAVGQSSAANGYGYSSGGDIAGTIDKFPFAVDANATDVGDLTVGRSRAAGQSSVTHGYTSGGDPTGTIDKFPFAVDANATDVGDLTLPRSEVPVGQSSETHGYTSGGSIPPNTPNTNRIDKFSFASDGNAAFVGNLTVGRQGMAGQSSTESGYTSGGQSPVPSGAQNTIDKFPFASDANATDVGDMTLGRFWLTGQQF